MTSDDQILPNTKSFLQPVASALKNVSHFGILADMMGCQHSRYDYVVKMCVKLFQLRKTVPGLGLSARGNFPPKANSKNPWKGLNGLSGLEICQSWAVLLNAGHLFGTFSTERGLLFQLDRDLEARSTFVCKACDCDDSETSDTLRRWVENVLDRAGLYGFHYALALWRIRKGGASKLDKKLQEQARKLICAFLVPPNAKIKRLRYIYRGVRQLTYLEMHGDLKTAHVKLEGLDDFSNLFSLTSAVPCDRDASPRWELFDSVDRYEAREFFGSTAAASAVLGHVDKFKDWWVNSQACFDSKVDSLFSRPSNWPQKTDPDLRHFVRLQLPSKVGWLHEVRLWLTDGEQKDPWGNSNFLITPMPRSSGLQVDLYAESEISLKALRQTVVQMSRALASAAPSAESRQLWLTTANFVGAVFMACLKPNYSLRISPVRAKDGHLGCATVGDTYELARANMKTFICTCGETQRALELRQLGAVGDGFKTWRVPTMMMFARTEIIDPDGAVTAEIDGLLGRFIDGKLIWTIVETKKGGAQKSGKSQLQENIQPCLLAPCKEEIEHQKLNGQNIWWFRYDSPDTIPIEATQKV